MSVEPPNPTPNLPTPDPRAQVAALFAEAHKLFQNRNRPKKTFAFFLPSFRVSIEEALSPKRLVARERGTPFTVVGRGGTE